MFRNLGQRTQAQVWLDVQFSDFRMLAGMNNVWTIKIEFVHWQGFTRLCFKVHSSKITHHWNWSHKYIRFNNTYRNQLGIRMVFGLFQVKWSMNLTNYTVNLRCACGQPLAWKREMTCKYDICLYAALKMQLFWLDLCLCVWLPDCIYALNFSGIVGLRCI